MIQNQLCQLLQDTEERRETHNTPKGHTPRSGVVCTEVLSRGDGVVVGKGGGCWPASMDPLLYSSSGACRDGSSLCMLEVQGPLMILSSMNAASLGTSLLLASKFWTALASLRW